MENRTGDRAGPVMTEERDEERDRATNDWNNSLAVLCNISSQTI